MKTLYACATHAFEQDNFLHYASVEALLLWDLQYTNSKHKFLCPVWPL